MLAAVAKQAQNLNGLHSKCLSFAHIATPKASLAALLQVLTQAFRILSFEFVALYGPLWGLPR